MFETVLNMELNSLLRGGIGVVRMDCETGYSNIRERQKAGRRRLEEEVRQELFQRGIKEDASNISVSHTSLDGKSWVIVIGSEQNVGVDLEAATRKTHLGILTRITTFREREMLDWDVLKFWVVKEAAFKSNLENAGTILPQYVIQSWEPDQQEGIVRFPQSQLHPQVKTQKNGKFCRFKLLKVGLWYVAFAHTVVVP